MKLKIDNLKDRLSDFNKVLNHIDMNDSFSFSMNSDVDTIDETITNH